MNVNQKKTIKTCICCKKSGHNITTCYSAVRHGILIENHIQAMVEVCTTDIKVKLSRYLRNLSILQQKILSNRIGENHLSCSVVLRYFVDKLTSRKIMRNIYRRSQPQKILSLPCDPIISPSISIKSERKRLF